MADPIKDERMPRSVDSSQDFESLTDRQGPVNPRLGYSVLSTLFFPAPFTTTATLTIPTYYVVVSTSTVRTVSCSRN